MTAAGTRSLADLKEMARRVRRDIITSTTAAGSGHPTSSLSGVEVAVALYFGGVLRYDPELAARIDAGELLEAGSAEEVEIRACAVHAGELIAARLGVPARTLDGWLWNRGQAPRYKVRPRHRARSVFY